MELYPRNVSVTPLIATGVRNRSRLSHELAFAMVPLALLRPTPPYLPALRPPPSGSRITPPVGSSAVPPHGRFPLLQTFHRTDWRRRREVSRRSLPPPHSAVFCKPSPHSGIWLRHKKDVSFLLTLVGLRHCMRSNSSRQPLPPKSLYWHCPLVPAPQHSRPVPSSHRLLESLQPSECFLCCFVPPLSTPVSLVSVPFDSRSRQASAAIDLSKKGGASPFCTNSLPMAAAAPPLPRPMPGRSSRLLPGLTRC